MNRISSVTRSLARLTLALGLLLSFPRALAAESPASIPRVIQSGFELYAKAGPDVAVDTWRRGGLLEGEARGQGRAGYLRDSERALGRYRTYELIEARGIGRHSEILYLSVNYERGAVYARFLLYQTEKDWVVQRMDFNTSPEAVMPWLAFEPER